MLLITLWINAWNFGYITSMSSYNFIAIDFETANYASDSACALSLVLVQKNCIVQQVTHLIKPPTKEFKFTYVHGLSWSDVADSSSFKEVWCEVSDMFTGIDFIAAHNATFDKGVLTACCEKESIIVPPVPYICTVKLARAVWNIYPTKLPSVCNYFKIPLDHHDPASDALACTKIVLSAISAGVKLQKHYDIL